MSAGGIAVFIFVFIFILIIIGLSFWWFTRPIPLPNQPPLPYCKLPLNSGDWEETCQGGSMIGNVLSAICNADPSKCPPASSGSTCTIGSTIDISTCSGNVNNIDGVLTCTPASGNTNLCSPITPCNFSDTINCDDGTPNCCSNPQVNGTTLTATCGTNPEQVSIDLRNCGQGKVGYKENYFGGQGQLYCGPGIGYC